MGSFPEMYNNPLFPYDDVIVKKILNKYHHGGDIYRLKKQKIALILEKS